MENYKILEDIKTKNGSRSFLYLVRCRIDRKEYILKKVECNDQTEANKALCEARRLRCLHQYQHISMYKDVFVEWCEDRSAVYICFVMERHRAGSLEAKLSQSKKDKEHIDENRIKKWLIQLLKVLTHLQNNKISHMNLKPSNIFLTKTDDIILNEFGVYTVLNKSKTTTERNSEKFMKWMPPEYPDSQRVFNKSFDMWSLGCVLFNIMTVHELTELEMTASLMKIRSNPRHAKKILKEKVKCTFTDELHQIVMLMLEKYSEERTTAHALNSSILVSVYLKTDDIETVDLADMDELRPIKPVPEDLEAIVNFMTENMSEPSYLMNAMRCLYLLIDEEAKFTDTAKKVVVDVMLKYRDNERLQTIGCIFFAKLAARVSSTDILHSKKMLLPISIALKTYPTSTKLQIGAIILFKTLALNQSAAIEIGKLGGVQDIINALRREENEYRLATKCIGALATLVSYPFNANLVCQAKGLQVITEKLRTYYDIPELVEASCTAIWVLSEEKTFKEFLRKECPVKLILHCIEMNRLDKVVVSKAFLALSSIVANDEKCAYEVLYGDSLKPGLEFLTGILHENRRERNVTESFAKCITELCRYDDLCLTLKSFDIDVLLSDSMLRFSGDKEVLKQIEITLDVFAAFEEKKRKTSTTELEVEL